MEKEKNLIRDMMEMVDARANETRPSCMACVFLAKDGRNAKRYMSGHGAHIATLLLSLVTQADEALNAYLPLVCAMFMLKPENKATVEELLANDAVGLKSAVNLVVAEAMYADNDSSEDSDKE